MVKHGQPHEIIGLYNVCKLFNKLPSEVEREDPLMIEAFIQIEKAINSKERQKNPEDAKERKKGK